MAATLSTQLSFDYGDLPSVEQKALERHADTVLKLNERTRRTTVESAFKIGEELSEAQKRLSNHGNGTFGKWCKERLGMSSQTARNLITVYERVPDKDCQIVLQSFDLTALYKLLADTAPEEAYRDALRLAKKGQPVSAKTAQEIIGEYTVDEGEPEDASDEGAESGAGWSGEFDDATAIDMTRSYIKGQFAQWPAKRRKLFLDQLRQIVNELDDPQLLTAENIEW